MITDNPVSTSFQPMQADVYSLVEGAISPKLHIFVRFEHRWLPGLTAEQNQIVWNT